MFVDFPLRVPAFGQRDFILVLGREPARERCVGGSPAGVFSRQEKKESFIFLSLCLAHGCTSL